MGLKEHIEVGLTAKCPSARVYRDIYLDSKRGKGAKADFLILHKTGLYLVLTLNHACMVYGDEKADRWVLKYQDGQTEYFENPVRTALDNAALLDRKCRGMGQYVKPVILFCDEAHIVEMKVESNVAVETADLFLSNMMVQEYAKDIIPPATRDQLAKQLQLLEMLSK